jgi:hemerythrin superfamily protein
MDPIKLIKEDHRTVKALFRKFERATKASEKQEFAEEIIEELSVHASVEEQLVYPVLRSSGRIEESVLKAYEEHHAVKLVLAELDKMKVSDERYAAKMHVVSESTEMHFEEEETKLLPALEKILDADRSDELARAMIALKQVAPNHPHPLAPDAPPAGSVASVFAKVADVGKDLLRRVTNADKARGHRRVRARVKSVKAGARARRGKAAAGRAG